MAAKVFIPFLQKETRVFLHQFSDLAKFPGIVSDRPNQRYGRQPKLGSVFGCFNVDVRRLLVLPAEKEKPMWPTSQDGRHDASPGVDYTTDEERSQWFLVPAGLSPKSLGKCAIDGFATTVQSFDLSLTRAWNCDALDL
jgi:hypothetical protein